MGEGYNSLYKLNNYEYDTLTISLKYPLFINSSGFGCIGKPFPAFTQGGLEPQFASKDSYFEQNIKKKSDLIGGS